MFERPGEKLKNIAMIFFVLYIVLLIIGFIYVLVLIAEDELDGEVLLTFLLFGGISILFTYIQCLIFFSFGKLVDEVENISYKVTGMKTEPGVYVAAASGSENTSNNTIHMSPEEQASSYRPVKTQPVTYYRKEEVGPDQWQCRKCGKVLANYVGSCGCGNTQRENSYL